MSTQKNLKYLASKKRIKCGTKVQIKNLLFCYQGNKTGDYISFLKSGITLQI